MDVKRIQLAVICSLVLVVTSVFSAKDEEATKSLKKRSYYSSCGKLDLVFLLDSSGSVGVTNFNNTLNFIKYLIERQFWPYIGRYVQIGVDVFSDSFHREIRLGDYSSYWSLSNALDSIKYRGGGTRTATALTYMTSGSFSSSAGHRSGVPKIAVIITDGKASSNASAIAAAKRAKDAGIYLLAVGVGSAVDDGELNSIASNPGSKNVFSVPSHNHLYTVSNSLTNRLCAACYGQVDVVFLIDTSTSLNGRVFNDTLTMIADVVSNSDVGSNDVMFGVDTFATVYRQQITLAEYASKSSLVRAVQTIAYHYGSSTNTALGIFGMQTVSFSPAAGHRPKAVKVGIVVTDGESSDKPATRAAAIAARSAGILMVAVGAGSPISYPELYSIATNSSYVYTGTSYSTKASLRTLIAGIENDC